MLGSIKIKKTWARRCFPGWIAKEVLVQGRSCWYGKENGCFTYIGNQSKENYRKLSVFQSLGSIVSLITEVKLLLFT